MLKEEWHKLKTAEVNKVTTIKKEVITSVVNTLIICAVIFIFSFDSELIITISKAMISTCEWIIEDRTRALTIVEIFAPLILIFSLSIRIILFSFMAEQPEYQKKNTKKATKKNQE